MYFEASKLRIRLNNQKEFWITQQCYEMKMISLTYFKKEPCQEDPFGSAENWVPLPNKEIKVSFTAVP